MINFQGLQGQLLAIGEDVKTFITEKPLATVGVGAGLAAATGGVIITAVTRKRKKTTRRKARTKKGRSRDRKFRSKQKHELAYVRRKRKAGKKITRPRYKTKKSKKRSGKIYYTKKGQPYKILRSGKARFIKKSKGRRR